MKKFASLLLLLLLIFTLTACAGNEADASGVANVAQSVAASDAVDTAVSTQQTVTATAVPVA